MIGPVIMAIVMGEVIIYGFNAAIGVRRHDTLTFPLSYGLMTL